MAIVNNYVGFTLATQSDLQRSDLDSDFGNNLNRSIQKINADYAISAGIKNTYIEGYINQFGASSQFSTNEQRMVQNLIRETININGITVRYMPRQSTYTDEVWNERPESVFDKGLQMDMILVATAGFEGEGDVMTQYGIEFREEVIMSMAIPRFEELYSSYENNLDTDKKPLYKRRRPLEGDLIVIPFGRSAANRNQYVPKVFEITRVTTYHDGAFFQLGDNYQYKIKARLFELSGEDLLFNPTVVQYNDDGTTEILADSETGRIGRTMDVSETLDPDTNAIDIAKDSDAITDSWGDNYEIEKRSQEVELFDNAGKKLKENAKVITTDYTAKAFGYPSVISNLDDI
jgi:hypothetical protein